MNQIYFATGNGTKFTNAKNACNKYGIHLQQTLLNINEIQHENPELIITDKVNRSFNELAQPVIVSDDSWEVPGLNGFPGPYMKSMNAWFSPDDFIHLTQPLTDRRIFLHSRLAYMDGKTTKIFLRTYEGYLLKEARGVSGPPSQKVISLAGDNDLSISEVYDQDLLNKDRDIHKIWDEFCEWFLYNKPA